RARTFRGLDARAARIDPVVHRRIQHPRLSRKISGGDAGAIAGMDCGPESPCASPGVGGNPAKIAVGAATARLSERSAPGTRTAGTAQGRSGTVRAALGG